jgi:uncharacterized repeat protein (TIGR03987 family)
MPTILLIAIITTVLALIIYTIAVWWVKASKHLVIGHVVLFWVGLVFDITGSACMASLAGGFGFNLHGLTGIIALLAMVVNAVWAMKTWKDDQEKATRVYKRASLIIWVIWLISFLTGMALGMRPA